MDMNSQWSRGLCVIKKAILQAQRSELTKMIRDIPLSLMEVAYVFFWMLHDLKLMFWIVTDAEESTFFVGAHNEYPKYGIKLLSFSFHILLAKKGKGRERIPLTTFGHKKGGKSIMMSRTYQYLRATYRRHREIL
ncbi:hypothetical protein OCU04_011737 [Sclerotinia nivalis]|uniref:Uncharacterized protein n=1 Tax=Sclerotinia nivalis TaxID=352851 RepID=A0A9X0A9M5_9HELO|nr:hypothetical protein OCU04_011737 [Sclerotinia nivalis]